MVSISLERAKAQLRVEEEWAGDDPLIQAYIDASSAWFAEVTGHSSCSSLTQSQHDLAQTAIALYVDYLYNQQEACYNAALVIARELREFNR